MPALHNVNRSTAGLRIDPARYTCIGMAFHSSMALVALHDWTLLPAATDERLLTSLPVSSRITSVSWACGGAKFAFLVECAGTVCSPMDPETPSACVVTYSACGPLCESFGNMCYMLMK